MKPILFFCTLIVISLCFPLSLRGQVMENNTYILELDELAQDETITSQSDIPTPTRPTPQQSPNESISSLFQSNTVPRFLRVTISPKNIDFGILTPTSPTNRSITLSLSGNSHDVTIYALEDKPLTNETSDSISDTSCDNGGCSIYVPSTWESTLAFGLGFSCIGTACNEGFENHAFRPFSQTLRDFGNAKLGIGNKQVLTIPLKVNIPGTQETGSYKNTITTLAVPSL